MILCHSLTDYIRAHATHFLKILFYFLENAKIRYISYASLEH